MKMLDEKEAKEKEELMNLVLPSLLHNQQNNSSSSSSIFSLTLDEIQTKSGMRSFGSMNMEDFIANIWSVEEDHSSQVTPVTTAAASTTTTLARQGSFSIPIPLCKKTVDEIWFQIHKDDGGDRDPADDGDRSRDSAAPQREQTLGEMTLEDFLVKAGVVQETTARAELSREAAEAEMEEGRETTRMGMKRREGSQGGNDKTTAYEQESGAGVTSNGFGGYVYEKSQSQTQSQSQSQSLTDNKSGKRRMMGGSVEVVVERRQRRMIKNRESAARSRARKQAYTVELEVELNQLKEENERLKKNLAESDLKRQKEVLMKRKQSIKSSQKLIEKLRTIRRAVSLAW